MLPTLLHYMGLCAPLFGLVGVGWLLMQWRHWPRSWNAPLSRFVFGVALPVLLFRLMQDLSHLPAVDLRVLAAFFGGSLIVFACARWLGWHVFRLDGVSQSLFALGGIFSNNALLGIPLTQATLGDEAMPTVALVLVFNSLTMWTLVTVSVEWARHGNPSLAGVKATLRGVFTNPIILGILGGTLCGVMNWRLPAVVDMPLSWIALTGGPLALVTLGIGLAEHGVRQHWRLSTGISAIKLGLQPLTVCALAHLLGLGHTETRAVTLLASIATGANVYLMSRQFECLEGPIAAALVQSTLMAALTTPLWLAFTA
jgi:predicted permease